MEPVVALLEGLTIWHWIAIGIVLMALEIVTGTFDLLWVGAAAFLTALFSLIAPDPAGAWQGQLVFFFAVAVVFVIMGRTVFRGMRRSPSSHPNLNARTSALIGKTGEATTTFEGGRGKVRIGDTVWLAEQVGDAAIAQGDGVSVTGADGTTLKVRLT